MCVPVMIASKTLLVSIGSFLIKVDSDASKWPGSTVIPTTVHHRLGMPAW